MDMIIAIAVVFAWLMDMAMYALLPASEVAKDVGRRVKSRRLASNLTQAGLASRSGVPLSTLKKFENTGLISLTSFIRILSVFGERERLEHLFQTSDRDHMTLDQQLFVSKVRKRGRRT